MLQGRWVVLVVVVVVGVGGRAGAEPAVTIEASIGPAYVFDTSSDNTYAADHTNVVHARTPSLAATLGLGAFVSGGVAVLAHATCGGPVCFAGPVVQVWPNERIWIGGGVGFGWDPSCVGRRQSCGVDTCACQDSTGGDAIELRAGYTSHALGGASVLLQYMQVGTLSSVGTANTLSLQVGYQWH